MVWIIILVVVVAVVATLWGRKRMQVLKKKADLERDLESVVASFTDLREKVKQSDLREHETAIVVSNIDRSLETLERWKSNAIPNITLWKNHTAPIEREFIDLQESVARELSKYEGLAKLKA